MNTKQQTIVGLRDLREKIINALTNAKWSYFTTKKTGSVTNSVITETVYTVSCYTISIRMLSILVQSIFLIITAYSVSPIICLSVIIVGTIFVIIFHPWLARAKAIGEKSDELFRSISIKITDGLHGLKPLKAMDTQRFLFPILKKLTIELEKTQVRAFMINEIPNQVRVTSPILLVALGVYLTVHYSLVPIAYLFPMIILFRTVLQKLNMVQTQVQKLKAKKPFYYSLKRFFEEINEMEEKNKGTLIPTFNENITINNITFSYDTENILSDFSMVISKGSFIALMGESGAGKTTFSDIIGSLYKPDSGEILIDGKDLWLFDINKWRQMIGYIPQDIFLFNDTIIHNITLGDSSFGEEDVVKALKDSGSWKFVKVLPDGINTIVGERGSRFSGGQRQRLSIARAILRKPQLLILDEATTALDPDTEKRILNTIRKLTDSGITTIAVSHQPAVLELADNAYKLGKGKLFKLGNEDKIEVA